jgi:hypothetical protein
MDYVDDSIHFKPLRAEFSPEVHLETVSAQSAITALRLALSNRSRLRNLGNLIYGAYAYLTPDDKMSFPHHGGRVLRHHTEFTSSRDGPILSFVNLLEPHNPHSAPPERGAACLNISVPQGERVALAAANNNKRYLLSDDPQLPAASNEWFDDWGEVLKRRQEIYESQIREFDCLVKDWYKQVETSETLVIVTGDHGQLFGEESMVGHHSSLHPHGVQVPLLIDFPASWESEGQQVVDEPVGWTGLSKVLQRVVAGEIKSDMAFTEALVEASKTNGKVMICADGPCWDVARLREEYSNDLVDKLAVRRVGLVDGDTQEVYSVAWAGGTPRCKQYEIHRHRRELRETEQDPKLPDKIRSWLKRPPSATGTTNLSGRLEALGYI